MGDEKFHKQGVKSADYSTLCMTTVSEDNTYGQGKVTRHRICYLNDLLRVMSSCCV